jgi:hypothetical protein
MTDQQFHQLGEGEEIPPIAPLTWVHCVLASFALSAFLWLLFLLVASVIARIPFAHLQD